VTSERVIDPDMGGRWCVRVDAAIAELADRQHGVVGRHQLFALGLGRHAIDGRVQAGRLHVVFRGAYAVGRRLISKRGVWVAAVLSCGPDALLSHRPAAALLGIREHNRSAVDVTVPRRLKPHDGIRPHHALVPVDERTVHAGIPVTSVARTLLDLANVLQPHELRRALEQAEARRLMDPLPLVAVVQRHSGKRGTVKLREALAEGPLRPGEPRSQLERRFLEFIDDAALPKPRVNEWIEVGGELIQADCLWREQRLIVELDSRAWHGTHAAFERDRRRDRRCLAAGWRVVRVTAGAIAVERQELGRELGVALSAAPARSA
jgi:very-short-patch-repair endonuclease